MNEIDFKQLPEYLRNRRWFAGKDQPIKEVAVLDQARFPIAGRGGEDFALVVLEVQYEVGNRQRYLLTIKTAPNGRISEALEDDGCARELLRLIRDQVQARSEGGVIRGERMPGSQAHFDRLSPPESVKRLTQEQSNTSLVYGAQMILKLIRKLEMGISPELEMGRFLASFADFRATPRLLGALHLEGPLNATLAVVYEFVSSQSDGWQYVLDVMHRSPSADPDFLSEVNQLGQAVGQLHRVLASKSEEPNFAPEPIHQQDLQHWSSSIIGELGVTLAAASKALPKLAEQREALVARAKALASLAPSGQKIRIHGDLHLGQVLKSGKEWRIFDFEGEPSRNFNQRREKHSPLRDVAGMLRSFAYATSSLELEGKNTGNYLALTREALLSGYLDTLEGSNLLPSNDADVFTLLDALELEKTLYELRYELQNRPAWIHVPARALLKSEPPLPLGLREKLPPA